jgi:integrase
MNPLHTALERYMGMRRTLGFKLSSQEQLLRRFVAHMDQYGNAIITSKLAVDWVSKDASPASWPGRLSAVRGFARYVAITEPRTQVPPTSVFPEQRRPAPYLYSEAEVRQLLAGMLALAPVGNLRRWTYYCIVGLLAVTGMRIGEALRLDRSDVDLDQGLLVIRDSKFGKSRIVPIHLSTVAALEEYAARRDGHPSRSAGRPFFTGERGGRVHYRNIAADFRAVSLEIGLRPHGARTGPRLHDLRHGFAVATLLHWYRADKDVDQLLPVLSTYLGHGCVRDTYWYLSACPELMGEAARRLEARWETLS